MINTLKSLFGIGNGGSANSSPIGNAQSSQGLQSGAALAQMRNHLMQHYAALQQQQNQQNIGPGQIFYNNGPGQMLHSSGSNIFWAKNYKEEFTRFTENFEENEEFRKEVKSFMAGKDFNQDLKDLIEST